MRVRLYSHDEGPAGVAWWYHITDGNGRLWDVQIQQWERNHFVWKVHSTMRPPDCPPQRHASLQEALSEAVQWIQANIAAATPVSATD